MKRNLIIITLLAVLLSSCSTNKDNLSYFTDLGSEQSTGTVASGNYEIKLIPDDELIITISSLVPEASAQFNAPLANIAPRSSTTLSQQQSLQTYVVDKSGDIMIPNLGKVHVAGLTTKQVNDKLTAEIGKTVKDPYVRVQLLNFRVNVLGEVNRAGAINVNKERYTILDAIADAGDLSPYGKRDNVLLIREENGQRIYHRMNLNDTSILSSPYFYLQQNDVIYVEPNSIKKANSKYNQDNGFKLSVISTVVSAASVIASLIIALVASK